MSSLKETSQTNRSGNEEGFFVIHFMHNFYPSSTSASTYSLFPQKKNISSFFLVAKEASFPLLFLCLNNFLVP